MPKNHYIYTTIPHPIAVQSIPAAAGAGGVVTMETFLGDDMMRDVSPVSLTGKITSFDEDPHVQPKWEAPAPWRGCLVT